jgi:putative tryptophan/tyrosine transport system substrate-binding protein
MSITRAGLPVVLSFALICAAAAAEAQSIPRIGSLELTSPPPPVTPWRQGLLQGLADLGYVEGQNVVFVNRWAEGREDRLPGLAAELLSSKVDVITSASTEAIIAARNLSKTIPIVMTVISDPIGNGLVASFARPGGNVTGLTVYSNELAGKRLELLRQVAPKITRVAVLVQRDHPPTATFVSETEAAAHTLGLQLHVLPVRAEPAEIARAFASIIKERDGGVIVQQTGSLNAHMRQMADLATKHRLPTVHASRFFAESGGLLAYGPSLPALGYRAATYVDKILKGAKPADLPVEQPTKFEFVINMKTAKALGLTIPPPLLLGADQLIE